MNSGYSDDDPFMEHERHTKILQQKEWIEKELGAGDSQIHSDECKRRAKLLVYGLIVIYIIIVSIFFMFFTLSREFRMDFFHLLEDTRQKGISGLLILGLFGFCSILLGFDLFIYDILMGYLIRPYWHALMFVSFIKISAKYLMFIMARRCFKKFIYNIMRDNVYFITCYIATKRKPIKILILLQFLTLPTVFKTYAIGLFRVSHLQYFGVTGISNFIWTAFWVYLGAQIGDIMEYLENGSTSTLVPHWFQTIMTAVSLGVVVYLCQMTSSVYKNIEEEAIVAIEQ